MRVAVVGAGISGLVCAWQLRNEHDLTVYEAGAVAGGHTHTVDVHVDGRTYPIDTGFIVFNDRTYPNFRKLLDRLGVGVQETTMSFSVRSERTGLEYNGTTMNSLFAQRLNLLRPSFWRMIRGILRFHGEVVELLESNDDALTLGEYLDRGGYPKEFVEHYILPMGGAIWSASKKRMREFPARFFTQFFHNHGMLTIDDRPQWFVVKGGASSYVRKIAAELGPRLLVNAPVVRVERRPDHVLVTARGGKPERFDKVILACHADQALRMLADPSELERETLGAIPYQKNDEVLHTDGSILPKKKLAHAAWNAILPREEPDRVAVTYLSNLLQSFECRTPIAITLNYDSAIDPQKILGRFSYEHPDYTTRAPAAQRRHAAMNGERGTYFAGAYWGYGFHEDGVKSALAVTACFGKPEIE